MIETFPVELDGAKVLYVTEAGEYRCLGFLDGSASDRYRYLAICKYDGDDSYYLFCCNENFEVENDWCHEDMKICMDVATSYGKELIWYRIP